MKTLASPTDALVVARTLAEVPILVVRPDGGAGVLEVVSTHPVHAVVSPTGGAEVPWLQRVTFPVETMSHLPSPIPSGTDALRRRIRASIANAPYQTYESFYAYLTRTSRLDQAPLRLESRVVPPSEITGGPFVNGHTTASAAAQVWFEGKVDRVTAVGDLIEIEGATDLPQIDWKLVPDDGSDPRDRGQRLPMPLGAGAIVRCVNLLVGAVTATTQRLPIGATSVTLADSSGLGTTGTAMFGAEAISWTGNADNTLTGLTRGDLGTVQADHVYGTIVFELDDVTLGVAAYPIPSVTGLFIRSFTTGATIEIPKLLYAVDHDDETTEPGDTGDGITTITLTDTQMAAVIHAVYADAAVTQQPSFEDTAGPSVVSQTDTADFADSATFTQGSGQAGTWAAVTTAPEWTLVKNGSLFQGLRNDFPSGLSKNPLFGLRSARFDFQLDVTDLDAPITVGLSVTGAEGVLSGFVDGSIVASIDLVTTGTKTVTGTVYGALPGQNVGDLSDVVIDLIKSEVTADGNPDVVFEVTGVDVVYEYVDDLVTQVDPFVPDDIQSGSSVVARRGNWSTGDAPVQVLNHLESRQLVFGDYTVDPLDGQPGEGVELDSARLVLKCTKSGTVLTTSDPTCTFTFAGFEDINDGGNPATKVLTLPKAGGSDNANVNLTLTAGATSADLIGAQITAKIEGSDADPGANGAVFTLDDWDVELTYRIKDTVSPLIPQVDDAQIQAAAGGIGLEFFAVCDGPNAPDANYIATSGDLMTHPSDLIQYWIREFGGFALADVDAAGTFDDADTNLVGYDWGFDARNLGNTWREILLRMGYEARANIVRPSGGKFQLLTAKTTLDWATPTETIDSHGDAIAIGKDDSEIQTRLAVNFGFDPRNEQGDTRSFTAVQTTDPAAAAVVTREAEWGRKDADPMFLLCHTAAGGTGVTDWRLYMEQEMGRFARVFAARVDHWQGYELEIGDVVSFVFGAETVKTRVIETQRDSTRGLLLRFAEVE